MIGLRLVCGRVRPVRGEPEDRGATPHHDRGKRDGRRNRERVMSPPPRSPHIVVVAPLCSAFSRCPVPPRQSAFDQSRLSSTHDRVDLLLDSETERWHCWLPDGIANPAIK